MEPPLKATEDVIACVLDHGIYFGCAERLARGMKKVYYHRPISAAFPTFAEGCMGDGHGQVSKVELLYDFWPKINEIDLFVFPDCSDAGLQLFLEANGKSVWGGKASDRYEKRRGLWLKTCEEFGLPLPHTQVVKGLTKLREYLWDRIPGEKLHIKISTWRGDMETWAAVDPAQVENKLDCLALKFGPMKEIILFYVQSDLKTEIEGGSDTYFAGGDYPNKIILGYEKKGESYFATWLPRSEMPEEIWKVSETLKSLLERENYCNLVSTEVRVKDDESYCLDPCFSSDTEILTNEGWKFFTELMGNEKVATLNTLTQEIEYHKPTDFLRRRYCGPMISISNREKSIECLVTPNHGVWRTDRHKRSIFVEQADSLTDCGFIPRTGRWSAPMISHFILPSYRSSWASGRYQKIFKTKHCPALPIPMEDWLSLLALYLSEGSLGSKWHVNIAQKKHRAWAQSIISKLPFKWAENQGGFVIHSVQLSEYLSQFGLCNEKWIPGYVGDCSARQIRVFLDAYALGDGGVHGKGMRYFTTSKRMADGIQELVFKAGGLATIRTRASKGTIAKIGGGKGYARNHDIHIVFETIESVDFWFETQKRKAQYITEEPYDGWVYDVTVKHHTVFVRRNGKPFWSSNCFRFPSPAGEEQLEWYANFPDIVWHGANGHLVQPEMLGKFAGEAVIAYNGDREGWKSLRVPKEIRQWVKLYACAYHDNAFHFNPAQDPEAIGCAVAIGDEPEDVIDKLKEIQEALSGAAVTLHVEPIADLLKEIETAQEKGIHFTDKEMPKPEVVLE
jgi:hypothetical protein